MWCCFGFCFHFAAAPRFYHPPPKHTSQSHQPKPPTAQEEWWQGYIDTQCGLFPATYVELVAQFATTFGDVEYEDEELSGDAASGAAADEKPGTACFA